MKRSLVTFLILIGALVVYAQPEKDLIGIWKMDASRSNFSGPRGAPNDVVISIKAHDTSADGHTDDLIVLQRQ